MTVNDILRELQALADAGKGDMDVMIRLHDGPVAEDERVRIMRVDESYHIPHVVLDT